MRTLELNKTTLWYVEKSDEETDVIDDDGYFTGEKEFSYSEPKKVKLHLYPASGEITKEAFGERAEVDKITSTSEKFTKSTLFFDERPTGQYDTTYTYKVSEIKESLNTNRYGLKGRC